MITATWSKNTYETTAMLNSCYIDSPTDDRIAGFSYSNEETFILSNESDFFPSKLFNNSIKALHRKHLCFKQLKVVPIVG